MAHSVTYSPDGDVLSVTVVEPRFTVQEKMLLLAARRKSLVRRGDHGIPLSVATDPKNRGKFRVPLPLTDFAEQALARERDRYRAQYGDQDVDSLLWSVELDEG